MLSRRKARIIAFQALYEWDLAKPEQEDLLQFSWFDRTRKEGLDEADLAFSRLLVSGTIENIDEIDKLIAGQSTNWELSRFNKVDLALLRLSVFSLLHLADIPPNITIDEAVEIAREYGSAESFRFVNGILDGIKNKTRTGS